MRRFLITTALEETWCADRPVLFLGEWCRRYDRKHIWERLDFELAPYHWDDREKLYKDYQKLQLIYEELLIDLSSKLNAIHKEDNPVIFWRVFVGPWLNYFLSILYDRWFTLKEVLNNYEISGAKVIKEKDWLRIPNDMADFEKLMISDEWNELIFKDLLSIFRVRLECVSKKKEAVEKKDNKTIKKSSKLKLTALNWFNKIQISSKQKREFFFIKSYIPLKSEFSLQLKLGQLPKIWRSPAIEKFKFKNNFNFRDDPAESIDATSFKEVAKFMLKKHIPIAYLEGYSDLKRATKNLQWPQYPRAIFTSVAWASDDLFKLWAATKKVEGVPLIIGQHGGNYGVSLWESTEEHQIAISNYFLTWGWSVEGQKKILPVGNFTKSNKKDLCVNNFGIALMVEMSIPRMSYRMYSLPVSGQWISYFEDQCKFVRNLPKHIRDSLLVRLYSEDYGWCQKDRWLNAFPDINLDYGSAPIKNLFKKVKICISTYNATTYLESMSLNLPTLIYWAPGNSELRDSAKGLFSELKRVGIFHETPEGAAKHLVSIWDNISEWWLNEKTQEVRNAFCKSYSKSSCNTMAEIKKLCQSLDTSKNNA